MNITNITRLGLYSALIIGLWALPAVVRGSVVYEQYFTNTSLPLGNQPVSYSGWSSYVTTATQSALNISNTTTTTPWTGISSALGNPNSSNGYLAFVNYATTASISAVTTGLSLNLTGATTVTWNMNSNVAMGVRFLVQIGSNWYASDSLIATPTAAVNTTFSDVGTAAQVSFAFNSLKTTWRDFTLIDGGSTGTGAMALGSTTLSSDLDTSLVTGIGFYQTGGGVTRIDSLVISTVPEPGTWALLVLSVSLGIILTRMRRRTTFV
ncbi:MAG: hypothetical protein B9S32_02890 [Verrucomicrobia bacterium Tous-C9LFEB]|nr:MAG: hypothetical protein B9S32_02890 [Verrucomicrobia bacterium Tous-C9LFEB]